MIEMSYEVLIRRAYHCGRYGSKGADADIYRSFQMAHADLPDNQKRYKKEVKEIVTFISKAITKALKEITIPEKILKLEELRDRLIMQENKQVIDRVIKETVTIFVELDLEIR
ncbi:MAG: hypothetical protein V4643_00115 [Bacteroidota bacterium]